MTDIFILNDKKETCLVPQVYSGTVRSLRPTFMQSGMLQLEEFIALAKFDLGAPPY